MADHDRRLRPSYLAPVLSLVPGLGHLVLGRARRGLALFLGATGCWNLALLSVAAPIDPLGGWSLRLGAGVAIALTIFAVIDAFRLGVHVRIPKVLARRDEQLQAAIRAYLRDDAREARRLLTDLLQLDSGDPVVRLYLSSLERRAGNAAQAARHARKALAAAPDHPLQPELERELHLARTRA